MTSTEPTQPAARGTSSLAGPLRDALLRWSTSARCCRSPTCAARSAALDVLDDERQDRRPDDARGAGAGLVRAAGTPPLRPRLRLAVVRGYDKELERVRHALEQRARLSAGRSAAGRRGGPRGGRRARAGSRRRSTSRSVRSSEPTWRRRPCCARLLEVMEANLEGTIADIDREFLHDFRVAVRRSRAVQRELQGRVSAGGAGTLPEGVPLASGDHRATPATSTCTCSSSTSTARWCPRRCAADLDPLLGVLRERRLVARRRWFARCAPIVR